VQIKENIAWYFFDILLSNGIFILKLQYSFIYLIFKIQLVHFSKTVPELIDRLINMSMAIMRYIYTLNEK